MLFDSDTWPSYSADPLNLRLVRTPGGRNDVHNGCSALLQLRAFSMLSQAKVVIPCK